MWSLPVKEMCSAWNIKIKMYIDGYQWKIRGHTVWRKQIKRWDDEGLKKRRAVDKEKIVSCGLYLNVGKTKSFLVFLFVVDFWPSTEFRFWRKIKKSFKMTLIMCLELIFNSFLWKTVKACCFSFIYIKNKSQLFTNHRVTLWLKQTLAVYIRRT